MGDVDSGRAAGACPHSSISGQPDRPGLKCGDCGMEFIGSFADGDYMLRMTPQGVELTVIIDYDTAVHLAQITDENHDLAQGDCCGEADSLEREAEIAVKRCLGFEVDDADSDSNRR